MVRTRFWKKKVITFDFDLFIRGLPLRQQAQIRRISRKMDRDLRRTREKSKLPDPSDFIDFEDYLNSLPEDQQRGIGARGDALARAMENPS